MKGLFNSNIFLSAFMVLNHPLDFVRSDYEKSIKKLLPAPYEVGKEYFKSPDELDKFIVSRLGKRKHKFSKKYLNDYKPLILSASNIFKVPFSFQSCLIYRESHFDKSAKSYVGALGMAQFTQDTYKFLSKALLAGGKGNSNYVYNQKMGLEELDDKKISTRLSTFNYNQEVYKKMYKNWNEYLRANGLKYVNLRSTSYKKVLLNPLYSIGLSSMYLFYLRHRLRHKLGQKAVSEAVTGHPELLLSVAGAYNQGARRLLRVASRDKGLNFLKWIGYQSRISETRDYIHSIRNCMKSVREIKKKEIKITSLRH